MITVDELRQKFPTKNVPPYGECIVVPGDEFDPDWEVSLGEQSCKCFMTDLEGKPVTLVKFRALAKTDTPKEVFHPEPKTEKTNLVAPWLNNSVSWKPEETALIISLWNEGKSIKEVCRGVTETFPNRTDKAVMNRISRLQGANKIVSRKKSVALRQDNTKVASVEPKPIMPQTSVKRWTPIEDSLLIELWNEDVKVPGMLEHFRGRTRDSIAMRIDVLQKAGRIAPRWKVGEGKRRKSRESKEDKAEVPPGFEPGSTPMSIPMFTPEDQESSQNPPELVKLLTEIRNLLRPNSFCFEWACAECSSTGSAEDEKIWRFCPVCGKPLIVWNVEANE